MALRSRVPESVKAKARPIFWRLSDAAAKSRGTLMPPRKLLSQVPGDFVSVGREFTAYFRNLGHLQPDQRVLDIGCGPGRMAIPLTAFLSGEGSYEGVDNWSEAVEWCSKNITPRFGKFGFRTIDDVGSDGAVTFPYEDASFDFAILGAISRLDIPTFSAYVSEAGRLLKPGGTYLGTCFLIKEGDTGEDGVRFTETELRELFGSKGLRIEAVYPGSWDDDPNPLSYQDLVVAKKVGREKSAE
jgi:SAM-dependent methyltransferase